MAMLYENAAFCAAAGLLASARSIAIIASKSVDETGVPGGGGAGSGSGTEPGADAACVTLSATAMTATDIKTFITTVRILSALQPA